MCLLSSLSYVDVLSINLLKFLCDHLNNSTILKTEIEMKSVFFTDDEDDDENFIWVVII